MGISVGRDRKFLVNYDVVKKMDADNDHLKASQHKTWRNDIEARLKDEVVRVIGFGIHRASKTYIICQSCRGAMVEVPGLFCPKCQIKKLPNTITEGIKCLIQRLLTPFSAG